jgi:predicted nucleic acid-binding protein
MSERDHDLGTVRSRPQEADHTSADRVGTVAGQSRDPLRVEEDHPRPRHVLAPAVRRLERHDEQVSLVVESVGAILEVGQRFAAERFEQLQVLLSAFERLLHRDHTVPEHSGLRHVR